MTSQAENTYRMVLMILVIGLVVSFGFGYLVGENRTQVITPTAEKQLDPEKLLQKCYDYANSQVVALLGANADTRKALSDFRDQAAAQAKALDGQTKAFAEMANEGKFIQQTVAKTCEGKKVTH